MNNNISLKISSEQNEVEICRSKPTVMIGERINPTGRKKVLAALKSGDFKQVCQDAVDQVAAGSTVLDINAGIPGEDEVILLSRVMQEVMDIVDVPLCIDTNNPDALEAALKLYKGKALVNSVNGKEKTLDKLLPVVKEYGAAVICLCMDDDGVPATSDERLRVADKIIKRATGIGIPLENLVVDPLVMSMGADSNAGYTTLETIRKVTSEFGVNITMGASNVSFGLPDRKYINSTFIAMAIQAGLTCPITNPLVSEVRLAILAADLVMGKDNYGLGWIKAYKKRM